MTDEEILEILESTLEYEDTTAPVYGLTREDIVHFARALLSQESELLAGKNKRRESEPPKDGLQKLCDYEYEQLSAYRNAMKESAASAVPVGWRQVIADAHFGLGAGSHSISDVDFQVQFGGALIDKIAEGLEILEAAPTPPTKSELSND